MDQPLDRPSRGAGTMARVGPRALANRQLMRLPIWLYKLRLGFLLGSRMLMLEHTGRASGLSRLVVLEVIDRPDAREYVVVSGFGERSQWYRNVVADPRVRIWVSGRAPQPGVARVLSAEEADASLAAYVRRHPRAWERFRPVLEATLGARIDGPGTAPPMIQFTTMR